jgi:hypothetical protein
MVFNVIAIGGPSSYVQYLYLILTVCLIGIVIQYSNFFTPLPFF